MAKERTSLQDALKAIEKKHGKGTVMRISKGQHVKKAEVYRTGVYSIDKVLGGGFAKGRIVELFGNEGSGKTTLALQTIVTAQKNGQKCAYIDVEQAFSLEYAKSIGVNLEELYFSQPDSAEAAMDIVKTLVATGAFSIIVLDSVAALVPATQLEADTGSGQIAHLARFMSNALKQIIYDFSSTNCTLILINQIRMNVGVTYGNPEVTPGGKALKFFASQRVALRTGAKLEDKSGNRIGNNVMIRVEKNKIAIPYLKTQVPFIAGKGFDAISDIFFMGIQMGLIEKNKITYMMGEEKLGTGELKSIEGLREREDLQKLLIEKLEQTVELAPDPITPEDILAEETEE